MPYRSASRAPSASAHGACTCAPKGEWTTTRQSPSSSRKRSTTIVRSSGTWPQAWRCSPRYASTLSAAQASRPGRGQPLPGRRPRAGEPTSRRNAPSARPSSSGRPSWSPFQNGSRPGTPGAGETSTRSRVMSSIRQERGAEGEDVADPGLVDHLLVELADPAAALLGVGAGQEDPEQPAVRDGAAGGDGQPLGAGAAGDRARHAVPHHAGPQLGEGVGRDSGPASMSSTAGVRRLRQRGEGRRPADQRPAARRRPRCRARSSRRSAGPARPAGWPGPAAPRWRPSRIRSVTTADCTRSPRYLGKTTPVETAPTWCPARPTRWRPEATDGGDSTWTTRSTAPMSMPSSRLEVATTAGSRPALRSSSTRARCSLETEPWWARASTGGRPVAAPELAHELGRGVVLGQRLARRPLVGDLVEPVAQPLGEAAGVGEDDRGAVGLDQVGDPLLDMRPDGRPLRRPVRSAVGGRASRPARPGPPPGRRPTGRTPCRDGGWTISTLRCGER